MHRVLACLLCAALIDSALAADVRGLQSLDRTHRHVIDSPAAEHRYHVFVGLPDSYEDEPDRQYPVVYVLDGGELYPLFVSYAGYLNSGGETPELIVVGIAYGTRDWRAGNNRSHDFTAPADDADHWGGAADFGEFLSSELMPMVEREYRANPARRIIFGQSLGGQYVLHAALTRPELFWGHIASNPALHRNLPFFLEAGPAVAGGAERPKLFVSSGTRDDARFRDPARRWMAHWQGRAETPWSLRTVDLDGHGHFSAAPAAFRAGLIWLFAED